ncbi:uncharacterized protein EDB91DRAFT_1078536 [Suillus paluster]|uniref:uncharacterized protein n=1 Tax=Suillus paluster TaxID=48578 RepID=UPI001B86D8D2|nr:uncharacterized protein EDB91DRAFT_1078536 [Suillus paluster]KAG1750516.1 hypothetical protein EDB91DRAFT_1078536 [Suillus paluster]
MVTLEVKVLGNKPKPVRPHPHAKGKSQQVPTKDAASDTPTVDDGPEDMLLSAGEADVVAEKPGKKQTAEKMKTLLKEAIRNAWNSDTKTDSNNNSDIDTPVSDKKGNNAALSTTKKLLLGGYLKNWANDVPEKAYPKSNTLSSRSESHTPTPPQSILSAATTSTSTSSKATSVRINKEKATKPDIHESDDVLMHPAALRWKGEKVVRKPTTIIVPASESDSKPEQMTYVTESGSVKWKAASDDVEDFVDETASEASSEATDNSDILIEDSQEMTGFMPEVTTIPTTKKKEYAPHKTTSVSTIVSQNAAPPPPKKLKKESSESTNDNDLVPPPSTQVPAGYYDDTMPPPSTQVPPGHWTTAAQEVIKPHGQYCNTDLSVPANLKWVKAFLSTAVLWAGSQPNPWEMSESVMADALQDIFEVVYPGVKYKVNPNGAVFAVTQQQLSEWRSNIGSAALAIIVDFCSCIKDAPNAEVAKQLLKKYVFIYEDSDNILWEMAYLSAFILQLMATNHLVVNADHIDVPALNTDELSLGGMDGAIMLCVVALERALKFVQDNIIKVEEVLASIATSKFAVKLPMVLNKATGKMSSGCYKFSFANCHEETESYMKSISSRS